MLETMASTLFELARRTAAEGARDDGPGAQVHQSHHQYYPDRYW